MPDFETYKSIKRIGFSSDDTLDKIIEKFIKYDKTSIMLITGVPGIGKSSITSWIANEYKDNDGVIILRFRDWESEELENGLLKAICNTLDCKKNDLEAKSLILDGFDEIKALEIKDNLFNAFENDINDFENFKCIITMTSLTASTPPRQSVCASSRNWRNWSGRLPNHGGISIPTPTATAKIGRAHV